MPTLSEQFKHIRSLIVKEQYDEALELLYLIDHPKADEWIEKVYARQGQSQSSLFATPSGTTSTSAPPKQKEKPKRSQTWDEPTGDPWNPSMILTFGIFTFVPLTGIPLALNWGRLGRKRWTADTMLGAVGILLLLGVLGLGLMFAFTNGQTELYPLLGFPLAGVLGASVAFNWGLVGLQSKPYQLWKNDGVRAMLEHKYNFTVWLMSLPLTAALFVGGAYVLYGDTLIPQVYENQDMTIQFPAGFYRLEGAYCNDVGFQCLYRVATKNGNQTADITLLTYDAEGFTTGAQIEEHKRSQLLAEYADITILSVEDVVVDGQEIRIRTYKRGFDKCADYRQHMYFVRNGTPYQISAFTSCERLWGVCGDAIDDMLYSIDFH